MKVKILSVFLMALMLFTSCASSKIFDFSTKNSSGEVIEYNEIEVEPYGIFNQKTRNDSIKYRVSIGNIVWSVLLSETVVVPVILCGWYLWEPKVKLVNTKYIYNEQK